MIRVLLIGCGDIALRTADLLRGRTKLYGLTRRPGDVARLRGHGVVPIIGDLDALHSLDRLRAAPFAVLHFAPPPAEGRDDPRTIRLIAALTKAKIIPRRFVYISTSGVYGDCAGVRVNETRRRRAQTPRARRRTSAEDRLRDWAKCHGVKLAILRVPGIYAETRLPLERLKHGSPVLRDQDDVFTNHIHADDLAAAVVAALFRGRANRAYNVADDAELKMGEWFDAVADAFHLPRPPRVSWDEAEARIAPLLLSFMSESRRLGNARMKQELRLRLKYPTPQALFQEMARRAPRKQLALRFEEPIASAAADE
ncbi:MAG: NAD-dependent epimerase/dehydratase family protein [Betaproteobacteria bacterium]|nr:MAG: NAD-dependent epimerase/dehydratase family protein [Betaproteobacteria bacterium]